MPELPSPRPAVTRRIPIAIGAVVIGALIGFAGVYGIGGLRRNATGDAACRGAVDLARKIAPLAHGEVAALTLATAPLRLPDLAFEDADGKPMYLIYNYKRGSWYPFVPAPGDKQRNTERELQIKAATGSELPFEPELERWFPLWGIPI